MLQQQAHFVIVIPTSRPYTSGKGMRHPFPFALFFYAAGSILPASCSQMAPEVVSGALSSPLPEKKEAPAPPHTPQPGETKWYHFLPEEAPGACLKTAMDLHWEFAPSIDLGEWKAYRPSDRKLIMEAKGSEFILYRGYVWDGATIGITTVALLAPTVVHDALYHALMHNAPITRAIADSIFRELMTQHRFPAAARYYYGARCAGAIFNKPDTPPSLTIEITRKANLPEE